MHIPISRDPARSISVDPHRTIPIDPRRSISKDPNRTISIDPFRTISIDPRRTISIDPNRTISIDPHRTISIDPRRTISIDPNRSISVDPLRSLQIPGKYIFDLNCNPVGFTAVSVKVVGASVMLLLMSAQDSATQGRRAPSFSWRRTSARACSHGLADTAGAARPGWPARVRRDVGRASRNGSRYGGARGCTSARTPVPSPAPPPACRSPPADSPDGTCRCGTAPRRRRCRSIPAVSVKVDVA